MGVRLESSRKAVRPCSPQIYTAENRDFGQINLRQKLSEPTERRRAQRLRKKTRHSGRSGQGDACEEHAQGNGETTVRAMRQRTHARRGAGIPATKYRAADGGCSAREESSFSPKRETSMHRLDPVPEGAKRGHGRGRSRAEPF